jgi:hypothetical protein
LWDGMKRVVMNIISDGLNGVAFLWLVVVRIVGVEI